MSYLSIYIYLNMGGLKNSYGSIPGDPEPLDQGYGSTCVTCVDQGIPSMAMGHREFGM
jgi:hypothetical protein